LQLIVLVVAFGFGFALGVVVVCVVVDVDVGVVVVAVVFEAACVRPVATPSAARTPAQPASAPRVFACTSHHLPLQVGTQGETAPAR
jgi:hypothetical protein